MIQKKCRYSVCVTNIVLALGIISFGCAEIEVPTPKDVVTHPFGTKTSIRGWTKEEVKMKWGEPDEIISLEPDRWGNPQEKWVYHGRYPNIPVDYKYLSKTYYFYFTGKTLMKFTSESEESQEKKDM